MKNYKRAIQKDNIVFPSCFNICYDYDNPRQFQLIVARFIEFLVNSIQWSFHFEANNR